LDLSNWQAGLWALPVGLGLGLIFYGGLWLTVQQAVRMSNPAPLLMVSFLLRAAITLGGLYYAGGGEMERTVLCLIGFVIMRIGMVRLNLVPKRPGEKEGNDRATKS